MEFVADMSRTSDPGTSEWGCKKHVLSFLL